ncbi:lipoprotein NlpI [Dongshaea marina]|uniref:lipoprotein NlpI n=1 Tax=Dongshaea marina TaxID=2047966 RepID=UPI00131F433A|nr:lipoprotein NlpI [Dongshaea marina]
MSDYPPMALPLQSTQQDQWAVFQLGHLLAQKDLEQVEQARLHYERGVIWDRLGQGALALVDFNRSLRLRPDFADVHFSLGLYLLQNNKIPQSYDEFDSAIELNPDEFEVYLQRGVALLYGRRPQLAIDDFQWLLNHHPYFAEAALWRYLARYKDDPDRAIQELKSWQQNSQSKGLVLSLSHYYLGELPHRELLTQSVALSSNNRTLAEHLCASYFYLGKYQQLKGNNQLANYFFRLAIAQNSYAQPTHRYALLELALNQPKVGLKDPKLK